MLMQIALMKMKTCTLHFAPVNLSKLILQGESQLLLISCVTTHRFNNGKLIASHCVNIWAETEKENSPRGLTLACKTLLPTWVCGTGSTQPALEYKLGMQSLKKK